MLRRYLPRRIFVPIAALMVLVVGIRSAYATYRCENDGIARSACCCPKADDKAQDDKRDESNTSIDKRCCCDIEITQISAAPEARIAPDTAPLHHALTIQAPFETPAAPHVRDLTVARIYVHPPAGPPLRVLKQSFLI